MPLFLPPDCPGSCEEDQREEVGANLAGMAESGQVDMWNANSGVTCGALIIFRWDGRDAILSLDVPELDLSAEAHGRDLFDGLQQLRLQLEPLGWYPLCNGARIDCYPSGMARDMGGARAVYELTIGKPGRPPLVGLFEPAPAAKVGTVAEQDTYHQRWLTTPKPSQAPAPPRDLDPRWKHQTGITVLDHGLPPPPDALDYTMSIPVASWTAAGCAVVLFLEYSRDPDGTIAPRPVVTMATFARDGDSWTAHRHFVGAGWSNDPIASPQGVRDLGGQIMVGGSGGFNAAPAPGHPAVIVAGRVAPAVTHIALIQDGHEDRRALRSHFGAWVVCTDRWSPYQINALDENGTVLASIQGPPPRLPSQTEPAPRTHPDQGSTA
jgi:hypothetical protein